jgi:hypothetical protein
MAYTFHIETLNPASKIITYFQDAEIITTKEFIELLSDYDFVYVLISSFAKCGFKSYMIKSSDISTKTLDTDFDFTLTNTDFGDTAADYTAFLTYLTRDKKHFQVFTSKSGNVLIIPSPEHGEISSDNWQHYLDIAGFLKYAPKQKIYTFWKYVKKNLKEEMRTKKNIILRTIGHHVPYLHMRIELQPI